MALKVILRANANLAHMYLVVIVTR